MDRRDEAVNFIDGHLIESFLDLTPQQMQEVVDGLYNGRCSKEDRIGATLLIIS
ncbi:hypothetical protein EDC94DRAFT_664152 [Helicostylum pulchrum]|nr:hypothetical protein EDC94DRAFT_664152 [Helicostylum pulchrum]